MVTEFGRFAVAAVLVGVGLVVAGCSGLEELGIGCEKVQTLVITPSPVNCGPGSFIPGGSSGWSPGRYDAHIDAGADSGKPPGRARHASD